MILEKGSKGPDEDGFKSFFNILGMIVSSLWNEGFKDLKSLG